MTQYFDFVALGWIEKYLREEMDTALRALQAFAREPGEAQHLQEALRNVHSTSGVLRLCALDPAALLTEEIERVLKLLMDNEIAAEARKLALTDLVAAIEALPAYLANVRAKREVSAGVIANVINDLRHYGNRSPLPDSLFFNPGLPAGAGISVGQALADDERLKDFAHRAVQVCYKYSKPALGGERDALKRLYAVGKHATPLLAGSTMEPYFRCYMGLIEYLAQPRSASDEVIVDVFKHAFVFLKSLARNGAAAVNDCNPAPYLRKMLYYIAKAPAPTALQQSLRDTFGVHDVDSVRLESAGCLIQEDDLLEALAHTMGQLLEVMEFITAEHRDICARNGKLVSTIVPRLRQVAIQLKAIGLDTHADTILSQHETLKTLSESETPAEQDALLAFGGALVAVKESLEHKLAHGLSAQGDSSDHDLDAAVMAQTVRCLGDMKASINREFTRRDLLDFIEETREAEGVSIGQLRALFRAATLVENTAVRRTMNNWEQGDLPERDEVLAVADLLLSDIPERNYAEQAVADMEQVISVLALMPDKQRESDVLTACARYIRRSIEGGRLANDAGMACFAEAIAALEQYMERRTADPLGNSDEHLDRACARAHMLESFQDEQQTADQDLESLLEIGGPASTDAMAAELDLEPAPSAAAPSSALDSTAIEPRPAAESGDGEAESASNPAGEMHWRDALAHWVGQELDRSPDAPLENPEVDIDEELVDCFVEESRKYLRRLQDSLPGYLENPADAELILDIRAIFHTMKGSARTIDLLEFGEFMYDMEKVFNALRDGYISGSDEVAELLEAVTERLPGFVDLIMQRVPLYTEDFSVPHRIAGMIAAKRLDPEDSTLEVSGARPAADPRCDAPDVVEEEPTESPAAGLAESVAAEAGESAEVQAVVESAPEADVEAPVQPVQLAPLAVDASDDADAPVEELSSVWAEDQAEGIWERVAPMLQGGSKDALAQTESHASRLVGALVPALVELRDGGLLEPDEATVGYFLDLPVIEQLASNAVFGLVDNGQGEFYRFPLSSAVTRGLQAYLDNLLAEDESDSGEQLPVLHEQVKQYIRDTLSLPALAELQAPAETISDEQLERYEMKVERQPLPEAEVETTPLEADEVEASQEPVFVVEDIDLELLDLYIDTLDEYLDAIDVAVTQLGRAESAGLQSLKHTLHTMKGGANSVGVRRFGSLVHDFESLLDELEHAGDIHSDTALSAIYPRVDELRAAAVFIRQKRTDWQPGQVVEDESAAAPAEVPPGEEEDNSAAVQRVDSLRVSTSKVDRLLDAGLEISMSNVRGRRALDAAVRDRQEVQGLARRVQDLVDKLSLQLDTEIQARIESAPEGQQFDPLEMDRITEKQSLAAILREAAYDLLEESRELGEHIDTAMREAVSASRLIETSQSELRLLRLVSFSKLGPGFRRLVHQVSRQLDKQVDFEFTCDEGGLDVGVFEQVKIALEHMLRNSVDHGIDLPAEREARGKHGTGKISLHISRQASEFVIKLLDDGKGLDPENLKARAMEAGLVSPADDLSEQECLELIFHSGLSTADKVTGISGRGVGMDAVHQSVAQVGGSIAVESKPGLFTQFELRIPASIMVNGALLASIGEEQVAIPLTSLDGSDFRHRDEIVRVSRSEHCTLESRGEEYKLRYLGAVRGGVAPPRVEDMPEFVPVLFAHHGRRRFAFYVDAVTNAEDLVIRSLGAQFTGVPGIAGGSLKSDGQPVLALDLNELIQQVDHADAVSAAPAPESSASTVILCVDDSVMMRRTYEKRLQSLGYDVITAVDGEDALDYLSETTRLPDFIFTDLEMPNMNGFDFIANLRRAPVLEDIPTVVVSSRDGEKHRDEAQRVGATDFMAKGANSAEGMRSVIERHIGADKTAA